MQVNPLIIILWLLITGWLWGILGVLLAVPLLVCIKLALERMQIFPHWLKLIEADESDLVK
jgi:predicted PurR-regulated permease PerM